MCMCDPKIRTPFCGRGTCTPGHYYGQQEGPCIGLFGTCGNSSWRKDLFIPEYEAKGIRYFNPQVENWDPSKAKEEAYHLANDPILLFPITNETYAAGSLSETGFSVLQALNLDNRRDIVLFIDPDLKVELTLEIARAKANNQMLPQAMDSIRNRALVIEHLKKLRFSNVYLVNSLEEMLQLSLELYHEQLHLILLQLQYNPHRKEGFQ